MKYIGRILIITMVVMLFVGCGSNSNPVYIPPPSETAETIGDEVVSETPITSTDVSLLPDDGTPENDVLIEQAAQLILESMTLEEKVGQMFIARCPDKDPIDKLEAYMPGGYILFSKNFKDKTKDSATDMIQSYQQAARTPMFIAVDEEGGPVCRISLFPAFRSEPFKSPQELYNEGGFDRIVKDTNEKAALLLSLGVNVNFAPVSDVSTNSGDYIYDRTFGKNGQDTAEYVKTVVSAMNKAGIGSVMKHFPGYGNNRDTHTEMTHDKRSYESFTNNDFLPFSAGIEAGAACILVSHNIVECMDGTNPASLSPSVHKLLREDLGFDGVIMTDDLYMEAIREFTGVDKAAIVAVQAGNDILCCTDFEVQIPAVINAVKSGVIDENRIDESVLRVLKWKIKLGIVVVPDDKVQGVG